MFKIPHFYLAFFGINIFEKTFKDNKLNQMVSLLNIKIARVGVIIDSIEKYIIYQCFSVRSSRLQDIKQCKEI